MKSVDYLYAMLRKSSVEGWHIGRKRYTIGTANIDGKWKAVVCSCFRGKLRIMGQFYETSEQAWEVFLTANYPKVMQKWRDRESVTTI